MRELVEPCENKSEKKAIILYHRKQLIISIYFLISKVMKTTKIATENFQELNASQMENVMGGIWLLLKEEDGTVIKIWI